MAESIEQGKLELLRTREEHANKQGELAVKRNKVAELEVELKLLSLRKDILQEQKYSLDQKKQELTEQLVSPDTAFGNVLNSVLNILWCIPIRTPPDKHHTTILYGRKFSRGPIFTIVQIYVVQFMCH